MPLAKAWSEWCYQRCRMGIPSASKGLLGFVKDWDRGTDGGARFEFWTVAEAALALKRRPLQCLAGLSAALVAVNAVS